LASVKRKDSRKVTDTARPSVAARPSVSSGSFAKGAKQNSRNSVPVGTRRSVSPEKSVRGSKKNQQAEQPAAQPASQAPYPAGQSMQQAPYSAAEQPMQQAPYPAAGQPFQQAPYAPMGRQGQSTPRAPFSAGQSMQQAPYPAAAQPTQAFHRPSVSANQTVRPSAEQQSQQQSYPSSARPSVAQPAPKKKHKALKRCLGALVILLAIFFAWYTWQHWYRHNDAIDIQGDWIVAQTGATIQITDTKIRIAQDTEYPYTLNPSAKTMDFSFLQLEGAGRYRFSLDRQSIVFVEGQDTSAISSYFADLPWTVYASFMTLIGGEIPAVQLGFEQNDQVVVTVFMRQGAYADYKSKAQSS